MAMPASGGHALGDRWLRQGASGSGAVICQGDALILSAI
jgi:hypothetical protein